MLAVEEAVVGGEEDVGVVQRDGAIGRGLLERIDNPLDQVVYGLQGFDPSFVAGVYVGDLGGRQPGLIPDPGRLV
jgi:hypothetical protein